MTNKPMLSVERELLERLETGMWYSDSRKALTAELRALLDKPAKADYLESCAACAAVFVEPAAQHQCDPAGSFDKHMQYMHENIDLKKRIAELEAAQYQGEPVAIVDESDDGLFIEFVYGENGSPLKCGDKLYAEQPAPEAVVMPDNLESHRRSWIAALDRLIALETDADDLLFWQHEHSALRDMYADLDRLNGVKP